ncbi:hypothetical protein CFC21_010321 [Triticum aestivum]|uniref:F-box domain-containing protein n=2 Tax=Triticum aestivum TaxID=4565 RepID=A0A3B5ZPJ0_WHEAT|nr:hypothetical protein CFC21_010321 [Triticum aestivum]
MKIARRRRRQDRLSKLSDATLGRILSFLPSKEAARAALLSSRWRDAFAGVDAVSLEEPESLLPDYEDHGGCGCMDCTYGRPVDPNPKPPFTTAVTAALLARHRVPHAPAPPLRALRAAAACPPRRPQWLELDLRLSREPICNRPYSLRAAASSLKDARRARRKRRRTPDSDADEASRRSTRKRRVPVSDDDSEPDYHGYTVPRMLFSSVALRSLSIGPCRLSVPAAVSMPSLQTLPLTRVSDRERHVQRLIDACPRLADLTLEACATVTTLCLLGNRRLRKLAIRCCHNLAVVAVNGKLDSLEYRGAVPDASLLSLRRADRSSFTSCSIDICGEEVSSAEELAKLGEFLQRVASINHLHLRSARLGSGIQLGAMAKLPAFTNLVHLELTGRLAHEDSDAAIPALSRILRHAPSLEVLSLAFDTGPGDEELRATRESWEDCKVGELTNAHQLRYNEDELLLPTPTVTIRCLTKRVREINLVHYQGGRAQRTLVKFLLRNAPVLAKLYCGFAPGPLSVQTKLRYEIQGWAMNRPKNCIFD